MTMKRLLAIWILLLLIPTATALDLSNYPDQFFQQDNFDAEIIIGRSAPSQDVTSAVDLIPSLQERSDVRIGQAKLDEDIDDHALETSNVISIGTACDNTVTARIMEFGGSCQDAFKEGEGYIYLYKSDLSRAWLVVAGGTPDDTQKAARVLGTHKEYNLQGNAVKVTGEEAPYNITQITLYGKDEPEPEQPAEDDSGTAEEEQEEPTEQIESRKGRLLQEKINRLMEEDEPEPQDKVEPEEEEPTEPEGSLLSRMWNGFKEWLLWFFK